MKELRPYTRNVFYYETDKMGVVHHSNYIRYFDEARVDHLKQGEVAFDLLESLGILLHTLSLNCEYKRPLVFDEPFSVYGTLTKVNGTTLELDYRIVSGKTGEVNVYGHSVHCFTDSNMRPIRLKNKYPEIYDKFAAYVQPKKKEVKSEK
ncbi:acyl-CoA thioester hydrolase [Ruminococcus flavefaciens]|uniref:Acyl-CoA thioester hydrolase n=1 Tax=Ruminococcus flavefaciens TaxID=1265 RepID=A0A1H6JKI1_RUMFL|nr:thioesterase family protein [Ruminococcus flavefaciens]SEH61350.1 acyl-CoA thioester hydrolase [Ruminococcus flavefaciens]